MGFKKGISPLIPMSGPGTPFDLFFAKKQRNRDVIGIYFFGPTKSSFAMHVQVKEGLSPIESMSALLISSISNCLIDEGV